MLVEHKAFLYSLPFSLAHRASTAFLAIAERCLAGIFSQPRVAARFFPPFLPRLTAAGFLR